MIIHLFLQIWDIAGQDHYRAMTRTYYRGASGCIVLFDLTDRRSFTEAKTWKEDLDSKVLLSNGDTIPCLLVANKVLKVKTDYVIYRVECLLQVIFLDGYLC